MVEESFIRDINEEIRQEKIHNFLRRYGILIIILMLIIVSITIAFQGYLFINNRKAARIGDDFLIALDMAKQAHYNEAFVQLDRIAESGFAAYPALAEMRKASILAEKGKKENAIKVLDTVVTVSTTPAVIKNMAQIRAAYLLVDIGTFSDVEQRVKKFATDIDPMRFAARDILGLAAWKAGKMKEAVYYFSKIYEDKDAAESGFYQRAKIFLELLQAAGVNLEDLSSYLKKED